MDYVKNIWVEISDFIEFDYGFDWDDDVYEWCDCLVCRLMFLDMENVCCRKWICVILYVMY